MKNILYIHQYFKTPNEGGAIRSYHVARKMVESGFNVHMITSHNQADYVNTKIEGITIHYLPVYYSNNLSFFQRYCAFLKFVFASIKHISKLPRPDLVYATSTPLTIGIIALWLKWKGGIPYFFEVRDLWPEAPIQLAILKNPILKWLTLNLEKTIYKNASKVIALSPGIEAGIQKKVGANQIVFVPNMADIDFFLPGISSIGPDKGFTIGYFGAFGMANNMQFIIRVAEVCMEQQLPVRFILAGEGAMRKMLEESMQNRNLTNIELHGHKNCFEIRELMKRVDACLTSFLDFPILGTNSPNKFFDGLAAGKLCIVNTDGWLRTLVEANQCGFYLDPRRPEEFIEKIEPFMGDSSLKTKYQDNARILAIKEFSKDVLTKRIVSEINQQLQINI